MTCIAYRDGILAGDSAYIGDNTVICLRTKLTRFPSGALYGGAGEADDRVFVEKIQYVADSKDLPSYVELRDLPAEYAAILVLPNKHVYFIQSGKDDPGIVLVENAYGFAIGTGATVAFGALAAGKSAEEAVVIACHLDRNCRLPVHTLTL